MHQFPQPAKTIRRQSDKVSLIGVADGTDGANTAPRWFIMSSDQRIHGTLSDREGDDGQH